MNIQERCKHQLAYFQNGQTSDIQKRIILLKRLKIEIKRKESAIYEALYQDFGKPEFEAYMTEIGMVYSEINYMINHIAFHHHKKWKLASLLHFPSSAYTIREAYGVVLIIAPWNYPFQLALTPLIGAVACGNCVVLKPSELSSHTAQIIEDIVRAVFDQRHVSVMQGDACVTSEILKYPFDYIFFTGSERVAKIVMAAASKHLTPLTLELGGKSPCIVDESANIKLAAKRIVWGKFINAGQTCIAPDYIYVHASKEIELIAYMKHYIHKLYPSKREGKDLAKIINQHHLLRIISYLDDAMIVEGGTFDEEELCIAPTILRGVSWNSNCMKDEIFGPILPILTYERLEDVIHILKPKPKPLACYIFSTNETYIDMLQLNLFFGGGCINDTIVHFANASLPFGGVGSSGMGAYHGKESLNTFSHQKAILRKSNLLDIPLRYPPFKKQLYIIKKIMR